MTQSKAARIAEVAEKCNRSPFHFATLTDAWICPNCLAKIKAIEEEME